MLEVSLVDVELLASQPKKRVAKRCPTCKLMRFMFEYHKDRTRRDGHSVMCQDCQRFKDEGGDFDSDEFDRLVETWENRVKQHNSEYKFLKYRVRSKIYKELNERESLLYVAKKTAHAVVLGSHQRKGFSQTSKTAELLGCTYGEFRGHLESQFAPGMGWHNRSLWHIDHIIPLCTAETVDDVMRLCHYTNLQPLWAKDNFAKAKGERKKTLDSDVSCR